MCRDQGLPSHIRTHTAITQDQVRQDGKHGFAGRALETPDGETAQAGAGIMGVACQAAALAATGVVCELEAEGEEEGEDAFDKRFAITKELEVGGFGVEIDGDGAVLACRFGGVSHVSSPGQRPLVRMRYGDGNVLKDQAYCERLGASPLNSVECGFSAQGKRFEVERGRFRQWCGALEAKRRACR
jgi:hypothetical protein